MTLMYVITFGTFSGFAAVFGLLINGFGSAGYDPLQFVFWGALVGSFARIVAGPIADKVGGGVITALSSAGIALACWFTAMQYSSIDKFGLFFGHDRGVLLRRCG